MKIHSPSVEGVPAKLSASFVSSRLMTLLALTVAAWSLTLSGCGNDATNVEPNAADASSVTDGALGDGAIVEDIGVGTDVAGIDVVHSDVALPCTKDKDCPVAQEACKRAVCGADKVCAVVNEEVDVLCDDGDACTVNDKCDAAGVCLAGDVTECDDNNVCTVDVCDKNKPAGQGCSHTVQDGVCSDGDACTVGDSCQAGVCVSGATADCDDNNVCTDDSCDVDKGCEHNDNTSACTDGDACTEGDLCAAGVCVSGSKLDCDDNNKCTVDTCTKDGGCTYLPQEGACDDGNACTKGDACKGGACLPGAATACDDKNPCTTDSCDVKLGCVFTPDDSLKCSDNDKCTLGDHCKSGKCISVKPTDCDDKNGCTADSCDPVKGCLHVNNTSPCTDGSVCTEKDTCANGKCVPGTKKDCDDKNGCTTDSCDSVKGCLHTPNTKSCTDDNLCTDEDKCSKGACVPGPTKNCDDNNVCTTDSCKASAGCEHTNNASVCSDGSVCTLTDVCSNGSCKPGALEKCDDNNVCTTDSCHKTKGCAFAAVPDGSVSCNDGNACTVDDVCKTGKCASGTALGCDDGVPCNDDSCDKVTGCKHTGNTCKDGNVCTDDVCSVAQKKCLYPNNTKSCNDGTVCTTKDTCSGGKCIGVKVNCDDNNPCTTDSCDKGTGCKHLNVANGINCGTGKICTDGQCASSSCNGSINLALLSDTVRKTNATQLSCHLAYRLNNNKLQAEEPSCWTWWKTYLGTPTSGKYAEYSWSTARTVGCIFVDTNNGSRATAGGVIEYWDGSKWVAIKTVTGKKNDWAQAFTPVLTKKIRLNHIFVNKSSGQKSNPVMYEFQVFSN